MNCPNCHVALVIAERQGVEIDYCPQCRGVWLDRGELDKILDRASSEYGPVRRQDDRPVQPFQPPQIPNPGYDPRRDPRMDPRFGHKRKRGGFLDDLFDFD